MEPAGDEGLGGVLIGDQGVSQQANQGRLLGEGAELSGLDRRQR